MAVEGPRPRPIPLFLGLGCRHGSITSPGGDERRGLPRAIFVPYWSVWEPRQIKRHSIEYVVNHWLTPTILNAAEQFPGCDFQFNEFVPMTI